MTSAPWRNRISRYADVDPHTLTAHPLNARRHPQAQRDALTGLLDEVGLVQNVVLSERSGRILDGHARVEEALRTGQPTLPATYVDLTEAEEALVLASLDTITGMASYDTAAAAALYAQLETSSAALQTMLSQQAETLGLVFGEQAAPPADPGADLDRAAELQAKWQVQPGDLWQIGRHRLLCGDSTNAGDVDRLMDGAKADLVVTSPPYADQRTYGIGPFDWFTLMSGVSAQVFSHVTDAAHILVNLGMSHKNRRVDVYWEDWLKECEGTFGYSLFGWYVWDKGAGMPGEWSGRLAPAHEFIFHFNKQSRGAANKTVPTLSASQRRTGGHRFRQADGSIRDATSPGAIGQAVKIPDSVVRIGREAARGDHTQVHPAVYPPALPRFLIETWAVSETLVYDPFLGSGTTMVAAEQLDRSCYGMELEPKYVAVCLERLSVLGLEPRLLEPMVPHVS